MGNDRQIKAARSEAIYRALREAIIEQALEPRTKLSEDRIGQQFGASRTLVRLALGRLAAEGLVTLEPNRGAYVALPEWDEAGDLFEVRTALERIAVQRIARSADTDAIRQLRRHVEEEAAAAQLDDRRKSIRLATEFHILLAELARSPLLSGYIAQLACRCGLLLAHHDPTHSADCAVSEHGAIIDALEQGDAERAIHLSDAHLGEVLNRALEGRPPLKGQDLDQILGPYVERILAQGSKE